MPDRPWKRPARYTGHRSTTILARGTVVSLAILCAQASAQVLHQALDTFGLEQLPVKAFYATTTRGEVTVTNEKVRTGTAAFKHHVQVVPAGSDTRRAELDNLKFGSYHPDSIYWHGFSLYLPASQFPSNIQQYIGQLRFSNIPWNGYTVPNCMMWKQCGVQNPGNFDYFYGGSGHHLSISSGHFVFALRYQEAGCSPCEALDERLLDVGPISTDVWLDFIYQAKWSAHADGFLRVWVREGAGQYVRRVDYSGPTWVEYHTEGSDSRVNGLFGGRVCAPNFTVGLYWNSDNRDRYCYSDNILYYRQQAGIDGFSVVSSYQGATGTSDFAKRSWVVPASRYVNSAFDLCGRSIANPSSRHGVLLSRSYQGTHMLGQNLR